MQFCAKQIVSSQNTKLGRNGVHFVYLCMFVRVYMHACAATCIFTRVSVWSCLICQLILRVRQGTDWEDYTAACPEAIDWATSYRSPLQQGIVWPNEKFTLSLRSLGKRMGTQKRKPMTLLGPAQGKALVLNLCVGMVVTRCFMASMDLSAFICGENSIGDCGCGKQKQNCISQDKHENVAFLFNIFAWI